MKFEQRDLLECNVNVPPSNPTAEFVRLSLMLAAIILVIYIVLGFIAEKMAQRLPPKIENAIGLKIVSKFDENRYPQTAEYLQKILDRLIAADLKLRPLSYKIFIVDSKEVNMLALPGGNMVVFTGLLEKLKSENALAMVIGHELGHYAHRDHLRGLGRSLVLLSIMGVLGLAGDVPGFIFPSVQTVDLKFSQDQETLADQYGIDLVNQVYGHTGGVLEVFSVLEEADKNHKRPGFFSTHPDTDWRRKTLIDKIQLKKYQENTPIIIPAPGTLPFLENVLQKPSEPDSEISP